MYQSIKIWKYFDNEFVNSNKLFLESDHKFVNMFNELLLINVCATIIITYFCSNLLNTNTRLIMTTKVILAYRVKTSFNDFCQIENTTIL